MKATLSQIESQLDLTGEEKKRKADLEKSIDKNTKEEEKIKASTAELEEEIKDIRQKLMDAGGLKIQMQQATVNGLRDTVSFVVLITLFYCRYRG